MNAIIVAGDEPALAETLASELPGQEVRHQPLSHALPEDASLIVLDDKAGISDDKVAELGKPVIRVMRPVRLSELLYTIRARLQGKTAPRDAWELRGGIRLLPAERLLRAGGRDIALTEKETELLVSLLENGANPVSREALLKRVWGYGDDVATHTIETHIYRLRGKLRQADESLDIVFSEEGGYKLKD